METVVNRLYEAMFLVDSAEAAADWDGINETIKTILERAEVEIVSIRKWDDRRLAYEINHKDRGTYILCYFRSSGGKIDDIERDVQLSERIPRVLILNAEHMSTEDIEKDTPAMFVKKAAEKAAAKAETVQPDKTEDAKPAVEEAAADTDEQVKTEVSTDLEREPEKTEPATDEDAPDEKKAEQS